MKKLLLTVTLLFATIAMAQQAEAQTRTGFGIRGGLNFATLNDVDDSPDSRTGLLIGLYSSYLVPNSPVEIQPEILYNQKGYDYDGGTVKLDYIQIPVLAKFNFITNSNLAPHVYVGPAIGFNVNSKIDGNDNFLGDNETDIDDAVNTTEFSVVVGAGIHVNYIDLGVRYDAGLTNVFDDSFSDGKNGVFSIVATIGL